MNQTEALETAEICIRTVLKSTKARAYGKNSANLDELIEKDIEALKIISRLKAKFTETK